MRQIATYGAGSRASCRRRAKVARKKSPEVKDLLKNLLKDSTAGDPMGGLRWTHKTTRNLAAALNRRGIDISHVTVGRLLREMKYSLRTNRKRLAKTNDPDRDRQFRLLARRRRRFEREKWPVISIDCKKKELLGNFKNRGRIWRRDTRDVLDHDFPSWADGRAIPFGVYDIADNKGLVVVGISRETSAFVINAIRTWWMTEGRNTYNGATRLAIECDCGGGNGPRLWAWKAGLQDLANEFSLTITVGHFPPGASKWNLIEHRMFSLISANWAGEPLTSYEVILKYIRGTRSTTGFRCRAKLDKKHYPKKNPVTDEQKALVQLSPHRVLPKWNYTIQPQEQ
jgi:hypothetical protein